MRKIFAYVTTIVTLIAMMIFLVPSVKENSKFAMEYTGGFEILYKTKSSTKDVNDNQIASTISDGMSKVLDIHGVTDSIITVEDGNYIRVNTTSKNQILSDEIRNLIQNNESYEITFRDSEDKLLATGDEILKEIGASYNGELNYYGYPIIYLNIKDTDLLNEITTTISQATNKNLVIWVGFEEGVDSYANIKTSSSTGKKVIYDATVNEPLKDEVITITGNYTEEVAKNTVNLVNSGTYGYDLEIVQMKSVKENDAIRNRNLVLISLGVCILLAIVAVSLLFKLEGIYSIPTIIVSEMLTIFIFNKINAVVNPQVIGAFILSNVILFGLLYIVLSKYKSILKTNKSPIKAYKETFKKNGPIIIDTCVAMILFAIITYFLGNNAHHFSILLSASSVSIFLSLYLLERFTMYLTCDCFNKNDKAVIMASSNYKKDDTNSEESSIASIDEYTKPAFIGFLSLISVGLIVILITTLAVKRPFGFFDDANKGSTIEIITNEEYFTNNDQVMHFFSQEEMDVTLTSVELKTENDKYYVKVTSDESLAQYENYLKSELASIFGENTDYEENYIVYTNDYNPSSLTIILKSTLYTSGIALLLVAVYFALRYKYSYSLATITSILMTVASIIAFFGITRIPVNSNTIIAISIITAFNLLILVPFFTRIKEYMKDYKKLYLSYQERVDCFQKGRNSIAMSTIIATGILDFLCLITMFFDLSNFSMYLAIILGSLFSLIYNMLFVPKVWILFENKSDKRKKTFKNRNISNSKYRTLDEQVFIGLND